jgi:hypothetical protein
MKGVPPFVVDPVDVGPSFQEELNHSIKSSYRQTFNRAFHP